MASTWGYIYFNVLLEPATNAFFIAYWIAIANIWKKKIKECNKQNNAFVHWYKTKEESAINETQRYNVPIEIIVKIDCNHKLILVNSISFAIKK